MRTTSAEEAQRGGEDRGAARDPQAPEFDEERFAAESRADDLAASLNAGDSRSRR